MSDIPDAVLIEQPDASGRLAAPRRDQIIATVAAVAASLAIHAVLILGYLGYMAYVMPLVSRPTEVLFTAQTEAPLPRIPETALKDEPPTPESAQVTISPEALPSLDMQSPGDLADLPDMGENLPDVQPYTPDFGSPDADSLLGRPEDLGAGIVKEGFGAPPPGADLIGGTGNVQAAGQMLSSRLQEGFKDKDILLVWVVDASPSLYDKIEMLKSRIQPLFDALNKENPKKLDMTVVSFDNKPELLLKEPTADPQAVMQAMDGLKERSFAEFKKKALAKIKNPDLTLTPVPENTMLALRFAANPANLKTREDRQIVIVLLTDEKGNDAGNWQSTLDALQKRKTPLFVFGPTTRFVSETKSELIIVRDDSITPTGVALVQGQGDIGSAEPVREPVCRQWGAGMFGVNFEEPAVAGPFELSALAKFTGGKYYFIDDLQVVDPATAATLPPNAQAAINAILGERQYNSAGRFNSAAMSEFLPAYDSEKIKAYLNSFGKRLLDIVVAYEKVPKPPASFNSTEELLKAMKTASDNIAAINKTIKQVNSLQPGPEAPKRWRAHRDLFLAQLYFARYTLAEYLKALEEQSRTQFSTTPDAEGFVHYWALSPVPVAAPSALLDPVNSVEFFTPDPVEVVIKSEQELKDFVAAHAALGDNQEMPKIDFNAQMLVLVSLGKVFSPDARIEITGVTRTADSLEIVVEKYNPSATRDENTPYFPNQMVAVPLSPLAPKFLTFDKWSDERVAEETSLLKGGKASAAFRQEAKIAISRVIRLYRGTPWEAVAAQMPPLNSVTLVEVKYKPEPPAGPQAPGLPGDF